MLNNSEIKKTLPFLTESKTILYPTDTVWGIGCDATSESAVKKIYQIKKRDESKSLIILVDGLAMLQRIIKDIPPKALEIIKETKRPTSIIYDNPIGLAQNLVAADNTVAIRIVQDVFCKELIHKFGKPIVSTSANISGQTTPSNYAEIDEIIKQSVDYIVKHTPEFSKQASRIIKISEDNITIIRE